MLAILAVNWAMMSAPTRAGAPVVPGAGFASSRYQALWTKSPFAVATVEETAVSSPDYSLVGIAQLDGVNYASLIVKKNNEHILVSSDRPSQGLTLISITRGHAPSDVSAVLQSGTESITLKLEQAPASLVAANPAAIAFPGNNTFPGAPQARSRLNGADDPDMPPRTWIGRPPIHVPPSQSQPQNLPVQR